MKVKEVMSTTPVMYCTPETKFTEAIKTMKTTNCGALPVVDSENKVLGIITYRDICLSLTDTKSQPWDKRKVGDVMSTKVYTVKSDDEISTAFQNMRKNQIGRLPVVDNTGKLNGVVSLHSLIDLTVTKGKKELWDVTAPGESLLRTVHAVASRYSVEQPTFPSAFAGE